MKKVYLAGGMHNSWRGVVYKAVNGMSKIYDFLDPMNHRLNKPDQYTYWDLKAIEKSDILLAYMEKSNPSGYGMMVEIGYAKALGKTIILVAPYDFIRDDPRAKYFEMAISCADVVVTTLADASRFLKEIADV
jgi:nucleoside 2-deoxyribosyltransferase